MRKLIRQIVTMAAKNTEHIPPINFQASGPMTFCYEVRPARGNTSLPHPFMTSRRLCRADSSREGRRVVVELVLASHENRAAQVRRVAAQRAE